MADETVKNDKDIEFTTPDTSVIEVASQITENIEFEKYKMKMNLFKWITGTLGIAIITMIINWGFKDRAVGMDEISQYDRYTTELLVLNENPAKKRMLAQFFSTVTPSNQLKCGWKEYYKEVCKDYSNYKKFKDSLSKIVNSSTEATNPQKAASKELLEQLNREEKAPLIKPSFSSIQKSPVIYIQYSNENKVDNIKSIQKLFVESNWNAPGIDFEKTGCDNSIRYFNDDDLEMATNANTLLGGKYSIKRSYLKSPKGQIEIWINNN